MRNLQTEDPPENLYVVQMDENTVKCDNGRLRHLDQIYIKMVQKSMIDPIYIHSRNIEYTEKNLTTFKKGRSCRFRSSCFRVN